MNKQLFAGLAAALCALAFPFSAALAQDNYPNKAVKVIVPYPAGGSLDTIARAIGQHLSGKWGQPVVVENRGGGSGMIGTDAVAKSPADGYTLLFSASSEVGMNVAVFPQMAYDPVRDLAPVTLLARVPVALLVHPSTPIHTLADLLKMAKASPGKIAYATPGIATPQHFAGELLKIRGQVDMVHVPYKGAAPFINDLLAGHVSFGFLATPSVMAHIKTGKMRVIALTSTERSAQLPQVPTIAESGLPGFEVGQWLAVFAPAATPPAIIQKLNADIVSFLRTPEFTQRLEQLGADVVASTPEELRKLQLQDISSYRTIANTAKIKAE